MSLGELESAVRMDVPLLVFVINDGGYGAELHLLNANGLPTDLAYLTDLDFAQVARAMGGQGLTVRRMTDLERLSAIPAGDGRG